MASLESVWEENHDSQSKKIDIIWISIKRINIGFYIEIVPVTFRQSCINMMKLMLMQAV